MGDNLKVSSRVGWRMMDNEVVAFNCANQNILILNPTASQLWERLYHRATARQLIDWIARVYSLDQKVAESDVSNFLGDVTQMGFVDTGSSISYEGLNSSTAGDDGNAVLLAIEMKAIEMLIPFAVTFEITYACNERCIHCYMDRNRASLTLNEIRRVLEELATGGCLFVTFTGGEFFARPDAIDIVEQASKLHFVVDILSNGTLINNQIARTLASYSVRRVQVSLYGATAETHDSITGLHGSFQKTIHAVECLTEAGVKVEIAFPLMKPNFHERYAVKQLVDSLGCVMSPSHIITARNDGKTDTFSLRLDDQQLRCFLTDKSFSGLYAGRKPFRDHQFYFHFSDLLQAAPCYSGFNSCAITPSGKVLPCNQLLYEVGDVKSSNFLEIWHTSPQLQYLRNLTLRDLKDCAACPLLTSCTRCPGLALLEGGDLLGKSPENCRVAAINE